MPTPTIQFKRGNAGIAGTLPVGLKEGEPAFTLNYQDFYIGLDETVENNKFFGSSRYWLREDGTNSLRFALVDREGFNSIQLKSPDSLSGITTYTLPETPINSQFLKTDENGNLSWSSEFDDISVNSITAGIGTFTNKLDVTSILESFDVNTGALVVDGGVGIKKNLNVGGNLSIQGSSEFVGVVTFRGGVINIGDSGEDDVNIVGEIVSNLVPNVDDTFSIGIGTNKRWKNAVFSGIGTFESGAKLNNISIGLFEDNTIETFLGNLILDSDGGIVFVNDNLVVSGISTFASDLDINASIDVQEQTILNTLGVTGVSTFGSNIDLNASLDVQDQTSLNTLDVSGISTFTSDLDINASIDVQDQTSLNTLSVSGISTFLSEVNIDNNLIIGGNVDIGSLSVSGISTFNSSVDLNASIDVQEQTSLNTLSVSGLSTFNSNVDLNASLDVQDQTSLNTLDVLGISTFGSNVDLNASIDVQEQTSLNALSVSGISTFNSSIDLNASIDIQDQTSLNTLSVSGVSTFASDLDINSSIDVQDQTSLNTLDVSGISTFNSNVDLNASLDVQDQSTLNTLSVSGLSTFNSNVDLNASLDVQDQTSLNTLSVSGISTLNGIVSFGTSSYFGDLSSLNFGNDNDLKLFHDGSGSYIQDSGTGPLHIESNELAIQNASGTENFARFLENSSVQLYYDSLKKFETTGYGATVLGTLESQGIKISGISTFNANVDLNASIDVQNQTSLNTLSVSGISTFNSNVDLNASLDVQNQTSLNALSVSGISTFNSNVDLNASIDVQEQTSLNTLSVSGISTFNSNVDLNASIDVQEQTSLNTLSVSGVSTFTSAANFNNDLTVSGNGQFGSVSVTNNGQFGSITVTGVTTSTGGFDGDLFGNAGTATSLATSRTFEITGDIVASPVSFDGTGNVSLAATIQPNSVGLGTDTFGDYIKSISGTANQITVTGGTGEGSTPIISIPDSPTLPGNVTVANDLLVTNNLNIYGNIMIGGTVAVVAVEELLVRDKQLVLGFTTDSFGNESSNDSTANGGGISIASTEGNPLVDFNVSGIHTYPSTYKDIIWVKAGTLGAGTTDAWHLNYAVGIGSTQVPNNVVLAAGAVQFTNDDLVAVRNINVSGISTFASDLDINASIDVQEHTQLNTLNVSGIGTFTTDLDVDNDLYVNGTANINQLVTTGISTFSSDLDINASIDVQNQSQLNDLNVTGISTFNKSVYFYSEQNPEPGQETTVTINPILNVVGQANVNNLNVSGITTFNSVSVAGTSIFDKVILQSLWIDDCAGLSQIINCIGAERILQNMTIDCGTY